MIRKTIFLFIINLSSLETKDKFVTSQQEPFFDFNIKLAKTIKQVELYQKDVHNLQNNFTALKKDYKDDFHELREDLRQAKNKKLNPWVKGLIVASGALVLFLIFWLTRMYYQLFWT